MTAAQIAEVAGAAPGVAYCQVIAQARFAGLQELSVTAVAGAASAIHTPYVSLRVGRILLFIENREALVIWTEAVRRALDLADGVFGPIEDSFSEVEAAERKRFERSARAKTLSH